MTIEYNKFSVTSQADVVDISSLLGHARAGKLSPKSVQGRRSRRRFKRQAMMKSGMLAALLAAEGCKTLGKDDIDLGGGKSSRADGSTGAPEGAGGPGGAGVGGGSGAPSAGPGGGSGGGTAQPASINDDGGFSGESASIIAILPEDLLANDIQGDTASLEIVRVFDAENGTVFFDGAIIEFVSEEAFIGEAQFAYEVRDGDGNLHQAVVRLDISEPAIESTTEPATTDPVETHEGENTEEPSDGGDGEHNMHSGEEEDHSHAHPDDPAKASEHVAALSLAPIADATHIAVTNGSWFDPNTWAGGEVPGEGARVLIPDGAHVVYDAENDASLFTIRVDGSLEFSTTKDTFMEVDTFLVSPSGTLTIGTAENPVQAGVSAVIQIADNGPIDVGWDAQLLSRGLVSHGKAEIHGASKDSFLKVATDPLRGDTSITFHDAPEGWQVGDKLVLHGTHLQQVSGQPDDSDFQDEELVITSIDGNVIHFATPLEFDHDAPRSDLKAYVANFTRNVQIVTENADDLPPSQRGHVMFMHSDDVDVRYAEFAELGRTDKSERAFDVGDVDTVVSDSNVKGRYSLHVHRSGVGDLDDPAMLVGNAVWGSPGWGIVHHDSNAIITGNAVFNAFGAAFVAETGNETGRWSDNIAIHSVGAVTHPKEFADVEAFDLGRNGVGFWFQGRTVDAVDNVAASNPGGHGFVYNSRGQGKGVINVDPLDAPASETLRYWQSAQIYQPNISSFEGNVAIGVEVGLEVIKPGPAQGHDARSVLTDFTAWEARIGTILQYTAHYTLQNFDLVAARDSSVDARYGVWLQTNTFDTVFHDANIDGFRHGFQLDKNTLIDLPDNNFQYVFIDVDVQNSLIEDFTGLDAHDRILSSADLINRELSFAPDAEAGEIIFDLDHRQNDLTGTKFDQLGDARVGDSDWDAHRYDHFNIAHAIEQEGWWTLPDGRKVTVLDQYIADRATGELIKVPRIVEWDDIRFDNIDDFYKGELDINNDAPNAQDDIANVGKNQSVTLDLLANDSDPEGDPLNIDGFVHPTHGRVHLNEDGTVLYVPDPEFTGQDEFWYWVEDDQANFTKAHVQINVDV